MPQGYITRVEKDFGYVSTDGGKTERPFRHWALAAEMGGRYPQVGAYVQFRDVHDPTRGDYITEIRQLTPPQVNTGRNKNVYTDRPGQPAGIARLVDGERKPLEQVLAEEETKAPIRRVERPTGPLHQTVDTEWELPT